MAFFDFLLMERLEIQMKHRAGMKPGLLKTWKCLVRIHSTYLILCVLQLSHSKRKVIRLPHKGTEESQTGEPPFPFQAGLLLSNQSRPIPAEPHRMSQ